MKRLYIFLFLSVFTFIAGAQDPMFNQFYNAPLHTNPALTGAYSGKWRAGINYRSAWSLPTDGNPYNSLGASFDVRFKAFSRDFFSLGFNLMHDVAGQNDFTIDRLHLSGSYMKQLAGLYDDFDSYLVLGFQAGAGKHQLGNNNYWFYNDFNFATAAPPGAGTSSGPVASATDLYIDGNIGLLWFAVFEENKSVYLGGSYFHANEPDISFLGSSDIVLDARLLGHAGAELPLSKSMSILPNIMYTQQSSFTQALFGMNLRYNSRYFRELALRAGAWVRMANSIDGLSSESVIPAVMLEYQNWLFGLSYEINATEITSINQGRGGLELSVYYVNRESNFRRPLKCPKF